jgi:hypothetical protein
MRSKRKLIGGSSRQSSKSRGTSSNARKNSKSASKAGKSRKPSTSKKYNSLKQILKDFVKKEKLYFNKYEIEGVVPIGTLLAHTLVGDRWDKFTISEIINIDETIYDSNVYIIGRYNKPNGGNYAVYNLKVLNNEFKLNPQFTPWPTKQVDYIMGTLIP